LKVLQVRVQLLNTFGVLGKNIARSISEEVRMSVFVKLFEL
jgi:hypothetical protein